ncbi:MAG TPA: MgtC/SapB family protein [Tissierellaceae bacterium]
MISQGEIIIRLLFSAIIGGLIGIEREANNRPAGLRTHVLVTVGSALIMLVSIDGFYNPQTGTASGDPARLAAQVVSGIGFLGAGTIMRTGNKIKGLTTAASLWVCAGIGLAMGSGYYLGGLFTTAIVLITLMTLRPFEERIFKAKYKQLELTGDNRPGLIGEIGTLLGRHDVIIKDIVIVDSDSNSEDDEDELMEIQLMIKLPNTFNSRNFFHELYQIEGMFRIILDEKEVTKDYL